MDYDPITIPLTIQEGPKEVYVVLWYGNLECARHAFLKREDAVAQFNKWVKTGDKGDDATFTTEMVKFDLTQQGYYGAHQIAAESHIRYHKSVYEAEEEEVPEALV